MFRKFMIVCWAFFGLCVMSAATNGYIYFQDGDQILGLTYQQARDKGIIDPYQIDEAEFLMYLYSILAAFILVLIVLFYTVNWFQKWWKHQ